MTVEKLALMLAVSSVLFDGGSEASVSSEGACGGPCGGPCEFEADGII